MRMLLRHVLSVLLLTVANDLQGQTRLLVQDSTLNNLQHPSGTVTATHGTLGRLRKVGQGPRAMVLIAGLGFGEGIWSEFMDRHKNDYTMYAVALPGFGGSAPLAMPPEGSRYAEIPWTRSTIQALETLLDAERLDKVTIVAHWALATQIALRLALDRPDRIEAVVIIGGPLKAYFASTPGMMSWTAEQRANFADGFGQRWFKTVTRQTWDDNNFMSYDYAVNPLRGLFLWREAQAPTLPVWIRYLLEFYTMDSAPNLKDLRVPTLVVQPGFDDPGFYVDTGRDYMRNFCHDSWKGAAELTNRLEFVTISQSRLFVMHDQPEQLDQALERFFRKLAR